MIYKVQTYGLARVNISSSHPPLLITYYLLPVTYYLLPNKN